MRAWGTGCIHNPEGETGQCRRHLSNQLSFQETSIPLARVCGGLQCRHLPRRNNSVEKPYLATTNSLKQNALYGVPWVRARGKGSIHSTEGETGLCRKHLSNQLQLHETSIPLARLCGALTCRHLPRRNDSVEKLSFSYLPPLCKRKQFTLSTGENLGNEFHT